MGESPGPRRVVEPRPQVDPEADPAPDLVPRGDAHGVVGVPLDERERPEVVGPLIVVADARPAEVLLEDVVVDQRAHVREQPYPGPVAAAAQPRAGAQPEQRLVAGAGAAEVAGLVGAEAEVDLAGEAALPRLLRGERVEGGAEPLPAAAEDASSLLGERGQLLPEHQGPRAGPPRGGVRLLGPGGAGRRRGQRNGQKHCSRSIRHSHATPRIGRTHAAPTPLLRCRSNLRRGAAPPAAEAGRSCHGSAAAGDAAGTAGHIIPGPIRPRPRIASDVKVDPW